MLMIDMENAKKGNINATQLASCQIYRSSFGWLAAPPPPPLGVQSVNVQLHAT
jgi:hypothetical protein